MNMIERGSPTGKRKGFTLIELMMALFLLSVALLGMAGLVASSTRLQRLAVTRTEMTTVAEGKLEELRSYGMTTSGDSLRARLAVGGSLVTPAANYADSAQSLDGRWYYRRWQITTGVAGTRRATVNIVPKTAGSYVQKSLQFSTLITLL